MDFELDLNYYIDIDKCVPEIGLKTIAAIVKIKSANNPPWVIHDNTHKTSYKFASKEQAIETAENLINKGDNLDLELAQINSNNLSSLNIKVTKVFEPCINLKASAIILKNFYRQAKLIFSDDQKTLFHAISSYNTGSFYKEFKYASKVWLAATIVIINITIVNIIILV
ncbi:MAG: lytic transglycosylase domain-containing protein [Rickettsiales endosymbiont of Dermacentor nuttalli]